MKNKNEIIMKDLWNKYNHIKDKYEEFYNNLLILNQCDIEAH